MLIVNRLKFQSLSTAPTPPVEGDIYYNAVEKKLKYYNGTIWEDLGVEPTTPYMVLWDSREITDQLNVTAKALADGSPLITGRNLVTWNGVTQDLSGITSGCHNDYGDVTQGTTYQVSGEENAYFGIKAFMENADLYLNNDGRITTTVRASLGTGGVNLTDVANFDTWGTEATPTEKGYLATDSSWWQLSSTDASVNNYVVTKWEGLPTSGYTHIRPIARMAITNDGTGSNDTYLYIWNFNTTSWDLIGNGSYYNSTGERVAYDVARADYVNGSGVCYTKAYLDAAFGNGVCRLRYMCIKLGDTTFY